MKVDFNWISTVAGLLLGFLFKVLYDELKSPKLEITEVSRQPFSISPEIQVTGTGFDRYYNAYRIKVANIQRRYLMSAADNCVVWLKLDNTNEQFQLSWVGSLAQTTLNVGDVREIDFCARGAQTGSIIAPTESGYFQPMPRTIGNGNSVLRGVLSVTCRNGRKAEKKIVIQPANNNLLEIVFET